LRFLAWHQLRCSPVATLGMAGLLGLCILLVAGARLAVISLGDELLGPARALAGGDAFVLRSRVPPRIVALGFGIDAIWAWDVFSPSEPAGRLPAGDRVVSQTLNLPAAVVISREPGQVSLHGPIRLFGRAIVTHPEVSARGADPPPVPGADHQVTPVGHHPTGGPARWGPVESFLSPAGKLRSRGQTAIACPEQVFAFSSRCVI